jgi:hypothetical protein
MNNSTISGNSNTGTGEAAGLYVGRYLASNATINDSTITGNSVYGPGAGLYVGNLGKVTVSRSIITGNTNLADGQASEVVNLNRITVDDYNLFGHAGLTTAQAITGFTPGPSDILATSDGTLPTILTDILDTLLQNNGGGTETHALPLTSPAVNGVADGSCAAGNEDQRHLPRGGGPGMGGSLCDIGAYEVQDPQEPPSTYELFLPAVLKSEAAAAQSNPQNSIVMELFLGLFSVTPLGLLRQRLFRKAQ